MMFSRYTHRTLRTLCLIGLTAGSSAWAQEQPARTTPEKSAPVSDVKTPGQAKPAAGEAKEDAPAGGERRRSRGGEAPGKAEKPEKTAYDYELPGSDGRGVPLSSFKGKTLLIVNLGRNSSYNSQLPALQKLSETYKDKGVVVIGVPSNEFGAAEPGTEAEIQKAYTSEAKVTFPVMAKSTLTGEAELPFYLFLTTGKGAPEGGPVHWNYTKFIVDKNGKVVARLSQDAAPDGTELLSILDQILDGTYKPKKAGGGGEGGGPGGGGGDGPPS
ncbi:glutathione peroxidase [Granulicella pectinivorans]|nr:glutathione peroxidase [Granulicella pectinivorans]